VHLVSRHRRAGLVDDRSPPLAPDRETCATTVLVSGPPDLVRQIAELVG
jgi:hypothetical protein